MIVLGQFGGIPIYVDPYALSVYLVNMNPSAVIGLGWRQPSPVMIGSVNAWGEWIAVNIAAAYRPEGVP